MVKLLTSQSPQTKGQQLHLSNQIAVLAQEAKTEAQATEKQAEVVTKTEEKL